LDISQTLSIRQLGKGHADELVPAGEALDLVVAVVAFYALLKIVNTSPENIFKSITTISSRKPYSYLDLQQLTC